VKLFQVKLDKLLSTSLDREKTLKRKTPGTSFSPLQPAENYGTGMHLIDWA